MFSYTKKFDGPNRWENDDNAIEEIKLYLGAKTWRVLREEADKVRTVKDWQDIDNALGFCGVRGYPVHAFGRRHCLTAYREWMHSGDEPVMTDEQGFPLS